jgi:NAD-reducing hydrogenase large subunit
MDQHQDDLKKFAVFPTAYMGLVDDDDALQLYQGQLRLVDAQRQIIEKFDPSEYLDHIAEHVESWSYLKFPYHKPSGWPNGVYRVGPLARLNASLKITTPLAQQEFELFHHLGKGMTVQGTLYYHYARLIEDLYAIEHARELLEDRDILSTDIRISGKVTRHRGVGIIEAPRGTLWHDYHVDENGILTKVNLIVATGNNNYAMSKAVEDVAMTYVDPANITQGALNRIEAAIRAYDPCLSCSTHAVGKMPMTLLVMDSTGNEVNRVVRDSAGKSFNP